MHKAIALAFILLFGVPAFGQISPVGLDLSNYGVRIEPDKRVTIVLATLEMATTRNAAGVDEKLINTTLSTKNATFRTNLLKDTADLKEDLRRRISVFVLQYKRRNPNLSDAELVSPFMSMAYTLSPAPDLSDPVVRFDLPGRLLDVLDFAPLVREFYRQPNVAAKIDKLYQEFRTESDLMQRSSTREMVSELLGYLQTKPRIYITERVTTETRGKGGETLKKIETREHERRFFVVPEGFAPLNNVFFLNVRDDYYVVVPPDTDLSSSEVRRAFLQFVIDPIVVSNSREVTAVRDWARPLLEEKRKKSPSISPDVFLAVSRSLVAAVDVRQNEFARVKAATESARRRLAAAWSEKEREVITSELQNFSRAMSDEALLRLYEDYEKGALLAFYFADQLKGVEDSGFDINSSLREIVASFDGTKEANRLSDTADARRRALSAREERRNNPNQTAIVAENPITTRLISIQETIAAKNYSKAEADLKQLNTDHPSDPRVYFNIGRVASLSAQSINDPELQSQKLLEAKVAYSNVLSSATPETDKALLSLTYVALGRIYEFFDDAGYAIRLYDEAIKLEDVKGGAFRDAIAAKQRLIKQQ